MTHNLVAMSRVRMNVPAGAECVVLHFGVMPRAGADPLDVVVLGLAEHWRKIPAGTPQVWVYPVTHFDEGPNGEAPLLVSVDPA